MALLVPVGGDTGDSGVVSVAGSIRTADPFTLTNLTMVEIVASTGEDWGGFWVVVIGGGNRGVVNIAKGGAGSEVRIATMPNRACVLSSESMALFVPVPIPAGTRVSVGHASNSTNTIDIQILGVPSSNFDADPPFTVMDCGPFYLENSSGDYAKWPSVDPGGTINTKGAWSEISFTSGNGPNNVLNGNSTPYDYDYFGVMLGDDLQIQTQQDRLWDVATGAAAAESALLSNVFQRISASEVTSIMQAPLWFPWGRSAGDRISMRMQSSLNDAADRIGSALLFGLR